MSADNWAQIRDRTIRGLAWSVGSQVVAQSGRTLTFLVLARFFLAPEDFGVVSMVTVFTGLAGVLLTAGFGQALIAAEEVDENDYATVFWSNAAIGIAAGSLLAGLAGPISSFYETPAVKPIAQTLAFVLVANSVCVVHRIRLLRNLQFRRLGTIEAAAIAIGAIVAIAGGALAWGAWAVVAFQAAQAIAGVVGFWVSGAGWTPLWVFSADTIRRVWRFSATIFSNQVLNYIARNLDKLLIGKYFGSGTLGLYGQADLLARLPVSYLCNGITNVLFPSFSRMRDNPTGIALILRRLSAAVLAINGALFLWLAVVAADLAVVILGPQWTGAVPFVTAFSIAGVFVSLRTIQGGVFTSLGAETTLLKINLVSRVGAITLFFAAVSLGPQAVAWSYVATVAASYVITTRLGCVLLRMSVRAYASALLPAAACIGGATIVAVLLTHYLHAQPPGLRLLIVSGAYLVSYVALSSVCNVATMKSLRTAVAAFRKPKGGGISQFR